MFNFLRRRESEFRKEQGDSSIPRSPAAEMGRMRIERIERLKELVANGDCDAIVGFMHQSPENVKFIADLFAQSRWNDKTITTASKAFLIAQDEGLDTTPGLEMMKHMLGHPKRFIRMLVCGIFGNAISNRNAAAFYFARESLTAQDPLTRENAAHIIMQASSLGVQVPSSLNLILDKMARCDSSPDVRTQASLTLRTIADTGAIKDNQYIP
jgi:hypothetical protein